MGVERKCRRNEMGAVCGMSPASHSNSRAMWGRIEEMRDQKGSSSVVGSQTSVKPRFERVDDDLRCLQKLERQKGEYFIKRELLSSRNHFLPCKVSDILLQQ